jgi:anthranilate synthase component 1
MPPFVGGAVGYFGYDCVRHVERLPDAPADDLGLPDMAFLLTDVIVVFDHLRHTITLLTNIFTADELDLEAAYTSAVRRLAEVKTRLRAPVPPPKWDFERECSQKVVVHRREDGRRRRSVLSIRSNFERQRFVDAVERMREYIYAGDAFQVFCLNGSNVR